MQVPTDDGVHGPAEHRAADLAERERIARELHDHVIQRLFAGGLSLQAALTRMTDSEARRRVEAVAQELDRTVRDIRTTIFEPHRRGDSAGTR